MFPVRYEHHLHMKYKTIPVKGRGGLQVCEMSRIPHCLYSRPIDGGELVSLTHRPQTTPHTHLYLLSFRLEVE
jgi:hypothetical protein